MYKGSSEFVKLGDSKMEPFWQPIESRTDKAARAKQRHLDMIGYCALPTCKCTTASHVQSLETINF
jgi:hypothetical protein